ncbi:uncharacterized protein G2W53_032846 [Senna tora]|uniref:Uncharacterized protein n=1 Tax=Senna tora TaxID=362788 RepID=A0A834SX70_9FABA|nr:uncharacterized protein G2W53_032846 [Senna tora]
MHKEEKRCIEEREGGTLKDEKMKRERAVADDLR